MTVKVPIDLGYEFEVRAKFDQVFALLSDVPACGAHFPKVDKLTALGDGVYRWEMQKVGNAQVNIQPVYASRYVSDPKAGTVRWTPVAGEGNAQVGGEWKVTDNKGRSTRCGLRIDGTVDVPLPALMRVVVEPVLASEFEQLVEQYVVNLIGELGGEV